VVLWLAGQALADCGSIPFRPGVRIFEPKQRALIAFNGQKEILLLSTDLRASERTKVLEVLPLPSEPKVTKGSVETLTKATQLINAALLRPKVAAGNFGGMGGMAGPRPAGEITFHEKIGAHEISVAHVLDRRGFVRWVNNYLRQAGVEKPAIPPAMEAVVAEYLQERFRWFVFDVVELGTETITKDAIQYQFSTRQLYFPLRITRAEEGETTVQLLVLSPRLLRRPVVGGIRVRLMHEPVHVRQEQLKDLDADIAAMFASGGLLRIWEISGRLDGFQADVLTGWAEVTSGAKR
jgi:hypothetical protein